MKLYFSMFLFKIIQLKSAFLLSVNFKTIVNYIFKIFVLMTLIVSINACHSSKKLVKEEDITIGKDQIVFLLFSIENKDSIKTIKLTNKIISKGKLKTVPQPNGLLQRGNLKCVFLNEFEKPVAETVIPNPLIKHFEYFNENGIGEFKEVILKESTFFIRIQLQSEMVSFKIAEIISENEFKELALFTL